MHGIYSETLLFSERLNGCPFKNDVFSISAPILYFTVFGISMMSPAVYWITGSAESDEMNDETSLSLENSSRTL